LNTRRRYLDTLSCVYGAFQAETSVEALIRNKWLRDVIENERELDFYKTQYVGSCITMLLLHKSDAVLDLHKRLIALCFPWDKPDPELDKDAEREEAVRRYQEMQKSGTIDGMKRDVSVNEVFDKWQDPLLAEEQK